MLFLGNSLSHDTIVIGIDDNLHIAVVDIGRKLPEIAPLSAYFKLTDLPELRIHRCRIIRDYVLIHVSKPSPAFFTATDSDDEAITLLSPCQPGSKTILRVTRRDEFHMALSLEGSASRVTESKEFHVVAAEYSHQLGHRLDLHCAFLEIDSNLLGQSGSISSYRSIAVTLKETVSVTGEVILAA